MGFRATLNFRLVALFFDYLSRCKSMETFYFTLYVRSFESNNGKTSVEPDIRLLRKIK